MLDRTTLLHALRSLADAARRRTVILVTALGLGALPTVSGAAPDSLTRWQAGDVEAAERYRELERERAQRYREEVARERTRQDRAEVARERTRQDRAEAARERAAASPRPRPAPEARPHSEERGLVARAAAALSLAVERALRDAVAAAVAEFEPWARDLAQRLGAALQRAVVEAWCEGDSGSRHRGRPGCARA